MNTCSHQKHIAGLVLLVITLWVFNSCRSSRGSGTPELTKNKVPFETLSVHSLRQQLLAQKECKYFSAQGQIEIDHEGTHFDAGLTLKTVRDSVCIITSKKLGIELSRVLITKDSFVMLDRTQQISYSGSVEELTFNYHLPIDFKVMQDLFVSGYTFIEGMTYELHNSADYYILKSARAHESSEIWCNPYTLRPIHFITENQDSRIQLTPQRYDTKTHCTVASEWTIESQMIHQNKSLKAHIEWREVSTKALSDLKFSIPKHYTRETL